MRHKNILLLGIVIAASPAAYAGDALQEYEAQCLEAIGASVPDFNCDAGTKVPTTHHQVPAKYRPQSACDRPNQLMKNAILRVGSKSWSRHRLTPTCMRWRTVANKV